MQSSTPPLELETVFFQGDIIWVQYPLTDKIDKLKKRPALIVSNELSNGVDLDYIVIPMTKTVRQEPFSLLVQPSDVEGDLPIASELRCNKPFTLRRQLIYDKIGGVLNREVTLQAVQLVADAIRVIKFENS